MFYIQTNKFTLSFPVIDTTVTQNIISNINNYSSGSDDLIKQTVDYYIQQLLN